MSDWLTRFESHIEKRADGCWIWGGRKNSSKHGVISINGRSCLAHRVSWALNRGVVQPGMLVCHHCDVPACVNPEHLFIGTHKDNTQDMLAKGRHRVGPRRNQKLDGAAVIMIRLERKKGERITQLSAKYGVSRQAIQQVVNGKSFKYLLELSR